MRSTKKPNLPPTVLPLRHREPLRGSQPCACARMPIHVKYSREVPARQPYGLVVNDQALATGVPALVPAKFTS